MWITALMLVKTEEPVLMEFTPFTATVYLAIVETTVT